jgi:cell division protein FtsI/penicillin-binding protein 2
MRLPGGFRPPWIPRTADTRRSPGRRPRTTEATPGTQLALSFNPGPAAFSAQRPPTARDRAAAKHPPRPAAEDAFDVETGGRRPKPGLAQEARRTSRSARQRARKAIAFATLPAPGRLVAGQVRLALVCALFAGCGIVLIWRLYSFQVTDSSHYQQLADQERDAEIPLVPLRGALLDTNGNPLAVTVSYDSVYVLGTLVGGKDKVDGIATTLSPMLEEPPDQLRALIDPTNGHPVVLKSQVPSAVAEQVSELQLPGVYLDKEPIRQYPEGSLAAQIVGFLGKDFTGLAGLELSYNDDLAGTPGVIDTQKDTAGQEITPGRRLLTPPKQGSDLVLTIDRYVQRVAERLLNQAVLDNHASGGLIIVMEPQTGNILAAANNPTYSLTADQIYDPNKADLYKSKIVTDQYEPGSTLKTLGMSAAIDQGIVEPDTTMLDTGVVQVGGATIHNWNGLGNGVSTMTQILIHSSNVGMTWVSGKLGADLLYTYFHRYGLGQPTGLRLPGEVPGTVRTNTDPNWTRVDQATNAFGQGIAVTPVQLIQAVSVFANEGRLVQPRLVRAVRGPDGEQDLPPVVERQVIAPETAHKLIQMLVAVDEQPDLIPDRVPGYKIAVKTGTADTPTNVGYNTALTIGSLVSLFPADAPRFAVLIRLDGPAKLYGGLVAAPVLKELAQEILTYYRVPPTN